MKIDRIRRESTRYIIVYLSVSFQVRQTFYAETRVYSIVTLKLVSNKLLDCYEFFWLAK